MLGEKLNDEGKEDMSDVYPIIKALIFDYKISMTIQKMESSFCRW